MRKSHTKGIFDAKFCKGILDAKAFTAAPLSAKVSTNGALSAKTSLQGVGTLALKSNFAAMNEGAAFAFEMAKANSTESVDCHASRGALARNDGDFRQKFTIFHIFTPNFRPVQTDKNLTLRRKLWFLTNF